MQIYSGTLVASNVLTRLTTTDAPFDSATFYAYKAIGVGTGINNTSGIWVGPSPTLTPNYIAPGDSLVVTQKENASNFYMVGASGDGLVAITY